VLRGCGSKKNAAYPVAAHVASCVGRLRDLLTEAAAKPSDADARIAGAVREMGRALFESFLGVLGRQAPNGAPDGYREVTVGSLLGHVTYRRAYYAPLGGRPTRQSRRKAVRGAIRRRKRNGAHVRAGGAPCACPLDAALGIKEGMTPALRDRAQRAAAMCGSFAEGATTLARFAGVALSESAFRRKALAAGERALADQECPALRLLVPFIPAWLLKSTFETVPTLYVMADGTGVPCVKADTEGIKGKGEDGKAGTRELKVGVVGTYRRIDRHGRPVRDPGCESHIVSANRAELFGATLRRLAVSRGYGTGLRIQIVGDGADWIANIVRKAFPGSDIVFTVDFFHACEYVKAFLDLAGLSSAEVAKAFTIARRILHRYGAATLLPHLRKRFPLVEASCKEAADKLAYIEKRQANMRYGEYRKQGLYIGSGLVEAACRTDVVRRCKQSGMHWRLKNAAAMCALVARFRSNLLAA
jgi:hypothetical protein